MEAATETREGGRDWREARKEREGEERGEVVEDVSVNNPFHQLQTTDGDEKEEKNEEGDVSVPNPFLLQL